MAKVRQETVVALEPSEAERLWRDVSRWATFIEGFARVLDQPAGWPEAGEKLVWESIPEGRGRVTEKVIEHVPGALLSTLVFEERLTGTQWVAFDPDPDGAYVELGLEYELSREDALRKIVDVLFIRRALSDSLARTLQRFRIEAAEEAQRRG